MIGGQKGYNTKTRQYRNFGMANPEGYRKALRLMKMAEKFGIPVLTYRYPGAYHLKRKNADKVRLSLEIYLKWYG
jgi:acetyl-CoA carboxylase carboxyl transferase subunit alpha